MAAVTYDTQLALSEMGHRRAPQALRLASNPSNRLLHSMSPLLAQSGHWATSRVLAQVDTMWPVFSRLMAQ